MPKRPLPTLTEPSVSDAERGYLDRLGDAFARNKSDLMKRQLALLPDEPRIEQAITTVLRSGLDRNRRDGGVNESCALLLIERCKDDAKKDGKVLTGCVNHQLHHALEALLAAGASSHAPSVGGQSLLHHAVSLDYIPIVMALLKYGDAKNADDHGLTPLMIAVRNRSVSMTRLLLPKSDETACEHFNNATALMLAVGGWEQEEKKVPIVALLASARTATLCSHKGITPLMGAMGQAGQGAILNLLIPMSDLRAQDDKGQTALMKAAQTLPSEDPERWPAALKEAMNSLFEGSDLTQTDQTGKTAWSWLVEKTPQWAAQKEHRLMQLSLGAQQSVGDPDPGMHARRCEDLQDLRQGAAAQPVSASTPPEGGARRARSRL